jgi:hypothetical protein
MHIVYLISKQQNPEKLLEFSKFAELHPKKLFAAASDTHENIQTIIFCAYHSPNVKFTISGHLYALTQVEENPVKPSVSYSHNKDLKYGC